MAEPPDFDAIAGPLSERIFEDCTTDWAAADDGCYHFPDKAAVLIVEQLRQVWNARGAADVAAVESRMLSDSSMTAAIKDLDR